MYQIPSLYFPRYSDFSNCVVYAGPAIPRYVRVNTLKMSTRKAITILRESIKDVRYFHHVQRIMWSFI